MMDYFKILLEVVDVMVKNTPIKILIIHKVIRKDARKTYVCLNLV